MEEYVAVRRVQIEAFETEERRPKTDEELAAECDHALDGTFATWVDGRVAGAARASVASCGVLLSGGATAEWGRGAYRALVRARWDLAVARGTPALAVGAGAMSRPSSSGSASSRFCSSDGWSRYAPLLFDGGEGEPVAAGTGVGLGLGALSATLTNVAYLREHDAAAELPALALRRPVHSAWLLLGKGFAMESTGFLFYVAALAFASLALVQSIAAGGIGVVAFASARMGRRAK